MMHRNSSLKRFAISAKNEKLSEIHSLAHLLYRELISKEKFFFTNLNNGEATIEVAVKGNFRMLNEGEIIAYWATENDERETEPTFAVCYFIGNMSNNDFLRSVSSVKNSSIFQAFPGILYNEMNSRNLTPFYHFHRPGARIALPDSYRNSAKIKSTVGYEIPRNFLRVDSLVRNAPSKIRAALRRSLDS